MARKRKNPESGKIFLEIRGESKLYRKVHTSTDTQVEVFLSVDMVNWSPKTITMSTEEWGRLVQEEIVKASPKEAADPGESATSKVRKAPPGNLMDNVVATVQKRLRNNTKAEIAEILTTDRTVIKLIERIVSDAVNKEIKALFK